VRLDQQFTGATIAYDDEFEVGVVHRLLIGESLKKNTTKQNMSKKIGNRNHRAAAAGGGGARDHHWQRLPCVGCGDEA